MQIIFDTITCKWQFFQHEKNKLIHIIKYLNYKLNNLTVYYNVNTLLSKSIPFIFVQFFSTPNSLSLLTCFFISICKTLLQEHSSVSPPPFNLSIPILFTCPPCPGLTGLLLAPPPPSYHLSISPYL